MSDTPCVAASTACAVLLAAVPTPEVMASRIPDKPDMVLPLSLSAWLWRQARSPKSATTIAHPDGPDGPGISTTSQCRWHLTLGSEPKALKELRRSADSAATPARGLSR